MEQIKKYKLAKGANIINIITWGLIFIESIRAIIQTINTVTKLEQMNNQILYLTLMITTMFMMLASISIWWIKYSLKSIDKYNQEINYKRRNTI